MNRILSEFVKDAQKYGIWVSIAASDLKTKQAKQQEKESLYELISTALNVARENCVESSLPKDRCIWFQARVFQEQMLIQISFSCKNKTIRKLDDRVFRMRNIAESENGYFKFQLVGDKGNIRIAVPDYQ